MYKITCPRCDEDITWLKRHPTYHRDFDPGDGYFPQTRQWASERDMIARCATCGMTLTIPQIERNMDKLKQMPLIAGEEFLCGLNGNEGVDRPNGYIDTMYNIDRQELTVEPGQTIRIQEIESNISTPNAIIQAQRRQQERRRGHSHTLETTRTTTDALRYYTSGIEVNSSCGYNHEYRDRYVNLLLSAAWILWVYCLMFLIIL